MALLAAALLACLMNGGCATTGSLTEATTGDPAKCPIYKSALDRADAQGVNLLALKEKNGTKLTPEQRTEVDAYNANLASYLASACRQTVAAAS